MELKDKLVSSYMAFEDTVDVNSSVHDVRDEAIKIFEINENGNLVVNAVTTDERGGASEGMGVLDVERDDFEFASYASQRIWPFIRAYNFATPLKGVCMSLFGLTHKQCYGTDQEKNTHTNIMWENLSPEHKSGTTTAREFLQFFGSETSHRLAI